MLINEIEIDNVEKFLEHNEDITEIYISKIVPDEFKIEGFSSKEILQNFLYSKIDDEFGKIENIINGNKQEDDEEEE